MKLWEEFMGKNYVVIGGSSGIGREISIELSRQEARVLIVGRNPQHLQETSNLLWGDGHKVVRLDVATQTSEIETMLQEWASINGPIHGGVYCAGICKFSPLQILKNAVSKDLMDVNFWGSLYFVKAIVSKQVRPKDGTSIVLIASIGGLEGSKGLTIYAASKAAMISAAKSLALELANRKVRVNCISPGWVKTPMTDARIEAYPGGLEAVIQKHPLGLGEATDVANMALFLLSSQSRWITGANFIVDGGYSAGE